MEDQGQYFAKGSALPFKTTDAILAMCLRAAGIVECRWTPRNVYTADILFIAGGGLKDNRDGKVLRRSRYSGLSLIEGARAAWKDRVKGRVEYHFEHSPEIQYFVDCYNDQKKIVEDESVAATDAGEAIRWIMHLAAGEYKEVPGVSPATKQMDEREAVLRIMCITLKVRPQYVNSWKSVVPVLEILTDENGKKGGKVIPLNTSDEELRKMKLL